MSRRFKSRNVRALADPKAKPLPPVELTDDNSVLDPWENVRKPLELNARRYAEAESIVAERQPRRAAKAVKKGIDLEV